MNKLIVSEGQDKSITEFDIKVTDNDTKVSCSVISAPKVAFICHCDQKPHPLLVML